MDRTILVSRRIDTPFPGNNLARCMYVELILKRIRQNVKLASNNVWMDQILSNPEGEARYLRTRDATSEIKKVKIKRKGKRKEETLADTSEPRSVPRRFKGRDISFRRRSVAKRMYTFFSPPKGIFRTAQFSVSRRAATCIHFLAPSLEEIKVNVRGNVLLSCRIQSESITRGDVYSAFRKHLSPPVGEKILLSRDHSFCTLVIAIRSGHDRFALKRDEISMKAFKVR